MAVLCLNNILICLLLNQIIILTNAVVRGKRAEFGEFCNSTSKCNKSSWLTCKDGSCVCAKVEEMYHDQSKGKCVSKAGERCKFEIDDNIFERSECVKNATCDSQGICVCEPHFYEISNGTCLMQENLGEPCTIDSACRTDKFLICNGGLCACDSTLSAIGLGQDHCIGLAGKPCLNGQCTPNSICGSDDKCTCFSGYFQDTFGKCQAKRQHLEQCTNDFECDDQNVFLKCWNGSCDCNPAYSSLSKAIRLTTIEKRGSCGNDVRTSPNFIHSTNFPQKYIPHLNCTWLITADTGRIITFSILDLEMEGGSGCENCGCDGVYAYDGNSTNAPVLLKACGSTIPGIVKSTRNQMYIVFKTDQSGQYRGFNASYDTKVVYDNNRLECVGLANKPCNKNKNCVKNAFCSGTNQCACSSNYAVTSKGKCGLSHGNSCNYGEDICSDSFVCSEGKCSCKHPLHQIFNPGDDKCLSIVSGPCSSDDQCIPGTFCKINMKTGLGFCECEEGFVENTEGNCEMAQGSACQLSTQSVCDQLAGLKCHNGVCSCPDESMSFSKVDRKCLGLVHFRCSSKSGGHEAYDCVENAKCVVARKGLSGICKCQHGFEETADRLCVTVSMYNTTTEGAIKMLE